MVNHLIIDLGGSNGRAMLGCIKKDGYEILEIHRFSNDPVRINRIFYWDILRLFHEIKQAITKAKIETGHFPDSIGIDAWGASFGLLDRDGDLIANPMHYRNECVQEIARELEEIENRKSIFMNIGYYPTLVFNAYHLYYIKKTKPELLNCAKHFLNISDLLNCFLTGKIVSETTIAATSLLYNIKNSNWDMDLIHKLGFNEKLFYHDLVKPGTVLGSIRKEICEELEIDKDIDVIAVAGHDTTSASVALPVGKNVKNYGYISCGTWSVFGAETDIIRPSDLMYNNGITFDEGVLNSKHIRKNINGLWIQQECKRYWEIKGAVYSYEQLEEMSASAPPFQAFIDVTDPTFFSAGNMPKKIDQYLKKTNQRKPDTIGGYNRIIIESLALEYKKCQVQFETITGKRLQEIYMIGGGIRNTMLCQFTANALNRRVVAGPVEATVVGNLMVQGLANRIIHTIDDIRTVIYGSTDIKVYDPQETDEWESYYQNISTVN